MTTYHHAACSPSGGGPRVTGMYGQGAPLDCAPPPWHECASAAGCSFHASTRQACSSSLACTVWGMRWCTVAPGLATHRMHRRLSLTPSAEVVGGRWWESEPRPPFSTPGSHPGAPRGKPRRALRPSPHARTAQLPCRELQCGRGVLTLMRACGRRWACRLAFLGALRPACLNGLSIHLRTPPCPPRRRTTEWDAPSGARAVAPLRVVQPGFSPSAPQSPAASRRLAATARRLGRRRARGRRTAARKPAGRGRRRRAADLRTDGRASDAT